MCLESPFQGLRGLDNFPGGGILVTMTVELLNTIKVGNVLGEGVLWDERRRTVWWTDIESSILFEYDPLQDSLRSWSAPYRVACFGFLEHSERLVVAFDQGVALYDYQSGALEWLVEPGVLPPGVRFNDGKIDPAGRFWVGSMVEDPTVAPLSGSLYCLDPKAELREHVEKISISNGLCWSPDGTVMYHTDSVTHTIHAYDFDVSRGRLSGRRIFVRTDEAVHPDGSTVDDEGGMWNAQWGGGQVVRYGTDGLTSLIVDLPVRQPTCVAFGGDALDLLFVTSARAGLGDEDLAAQPQAGDLFIFSTSYKGIPTSCLSWPGA